jgi:hypothetical protein
MAGDMDKLLIDLLLADMQDTLAASKNEERTGHLRDDPLYAWMRQVSERTGTILVRNRQGEEQLFTCVIVERKTNTFIVYGLPPDEWFEQVSEDSTAEWDYDVSGPPYQVRKEPKYVFKPLESHGSEPSRHVILGMESSQQANEFFVSDTGAAKHAATLIPIAEGTRDPISEMNTR